MLYDPDFVPFDPPPRPLGLSRLPKLMHNYLETIPQSAYEEGVTRFGRPGAEVLLVCEPDVIGEILVEKAELFSRDPVARRSFKPMIGGNSLFLSEGAEWRWQRRAVARMFRHDTLLSFVPVFARLALHQVEQWRTAKQDGPIDVAAAMTRTTFNIIVETMFAGSTRLDAERYSRALATSFETLPWHLIYSVLGLPEWMPFPHRRRARRAREFLHRDIERIVAARRQAKPAQADLLDLLLAARDPDTGRTMNDGEVVNNLITFITAGHETTAVALTWTLWLLAKDQIAQQRVVDEVASVAGDAPITAADVARLTYCAQVIQEAMRLFPPAPAISRQPKSALTLAGMPIGPRARVHIPIFALHRNIRLWDNANAFDPERFAPEEAARRPRYAYLPFGGGPRICIGAAFATIEATVILATLIRAFRLTALPGHRPKPVARITLRPSGGMPLLITPR